MSDSKIDMREFFEPHEFDLACPNNCTHWLEWSDQGKGMVWCDKCDEDLKPVKLHGQADRMNRAIRILMNKE